MNGDDDVVVTPRPRAPSSAPSGVITRDSQGRLVFDAEVPGSDSIFPSLSTDAPSASLWRAVSCGVVIHGADGAIADANDAATQLFGLPLDGLRGLHLAVPPLECVDEHGAELDRASSLVARAIVTGEGQRNLTLGIRGPEGRRRWLQADAAPVFDTDGRIAHVVTTFVDVTLRKEDEESRAQMRLQLLQAERLASVGTLAAGVSHEINNPLAYVLTNIDFLSQELAPPEASEVRAAIDEARIGVQRAVAIVKDLKALAYAEDEQRTDADVNLMLEAACNAVQSELRPDDHLERSFGVSCQVRANESRLRQVFLHLLLNAVQSGVAGVPNAISVRTSAASGQRIAIDIEDHGAGVPADEIDRIFDPFFTRRRGLGGTGLGLAICHSVVNTLGGTIEVTSEAGRGSSFRVTLPVLESSKAVLAKASGAASTTDSPPAKTARLRVFMIDDEVVLTRALQRAIGREHEVVISNDAVQAVESLLSAGVIDGFDVVLCDLMMPGLSGIELYERVIARFPEQAEKFVFMSGGAFTPRAREFLANIGSPRLDKPFAIAELRALLGARSKAVRK